HERLARREQRERSRVEEGCRELGGGEERLPRLRPVDDVGHHEERDEDEAECDRRVLRQQPLSRAEASLGRRDLGRRRTHARRLCRIARPPIITTTMISEPWITCAQFWSTPLRMSVVFTSVTTNAAAIGPIRPPTPPTRE